MVAQINDCLFLKDKVISVNNTKPIKVPTFYPSIIKKYYQQELNKKYASIEIRDDDSDDSSYTIIDSDNLINRVIHINYDNLNIIRMPTKQAQKLHTFYLSKLKNNEKDSKRFIVDNSLELYNLREENKRLKQEIERLKYLCQEKNNNV